MDPGARTMTTSGLSVRWSLTAPEEILGLSWNGSPNRTRSWGEFCGETNHEFFGNAWAIESGGSFASLVGMGSAGTWSAPTDRRVAIDSAANGCFGTNGTRVSTTYNFFAGGGAADKLRVQRTFEFGTTPFDRDLRSYIPRLYPRDAFSTVVYPNASGSALVTRVVAPDCEFGCLVTDWNGDWFAIHDPQSGAGMVVRHATTTYPVALWLDADGGSSTNASSVALLRPPGGFTGSVTDVQFLCFYDAKSWAPRLALPAGC